MSPELADFLTRLFLSSRQVEVMPDAAGYHIRSFYDYLHACDIEHCNFGGFEIHGSERDVEAHVNEFSGSLLPEKFLEEFTAELAQDDFILLRAAELNKEQSIAVFNFGVPHLDEVRSFGEGSARVTEECARYGMYDGIAMTGRVPAPQSSGVDRYYGFAFGGTGGSGKRARELFGELQIASFALLDRIMPRVEASLDGFRYDLSARERDILALAANGAQRQQIAFQLNISVPTVDLHLANLRRKMNAHTIAEAVAKGYRYGVL